MKHFVLACVVALVLLLLPDGVYAVGWVQQESPPLPNAPSGLDIVSFGDTRHGCAMANITSGGGRAYVAVLTTSDGGATWVRRADVEPMLETDVASLQMLDATHGWAAAYSSAGGFGMILSTGDGGVTWQLALITPRQLWAMSFADSVHGWVAGEMGAIYSTADRGATWQDLSSWQPDWGVFAMDFADVRHGCLVGAQTAGWAARVTSDACSTWQAPSPIALTSLPRGVALRDQGHGVIASASGPATIDGTTVIFRDPNVDLAAVAFGDAQHVHAVGLTSVILISEDAGLTWHTQASPVSASFRAVSFIDERHGWAVGSGPTIIAYDSAAASTTATGADGLWHNRLQTVHLSSVDDPDSSGIAGVASITTQMNNRTPVTTAGAQTDVVVPADSGGHTTDGVNTISYYATDKADNAEAAKTVTVRMDTRRPQTAAPARARVRSGRTARLKYIVNDQEPCGGTAAVTIKVSNKKHKVVRTLALGPQQVNVTLKANFECSLPHGRYRYSVYATDIAGNKQSTVGSNLLIVR
jgi:photosystem II stability/assembly factor-like uncharacterized protein